MKAYKKWSLVGLIVSASMAICAITFSHTSFSSSAFKKGNASEYTLTLNSSNSYSTGSEQSITTDSGDYQVVFSYSSCVSASSAHALINDGGTIINKDHIRSISKLQATYTGGKLKARTSYDRSTWGEYFELSSGFEYSFGSYPYYVELKAFDAVTLTNAKFSYTCLENAAAHEEAQPENESLLGVISFWNTTNLNDTSCQDDVTAAYVDTVSYSDTALTTPADIVSSVSSNGKVYQKRYGGVGMSSSSNNGEFTLTFNNSFKPKRIRVKAATYDSSGQINGENLTFRAQKATTDLANSDELVFNYETAQSSFKLTATNRVALYQIYLYTITGGKPDYDTPKDEVGFTATDSKKDTYLENSVFDTANGLSASALFSDGTSETLAESAYSYKIYNSLEQEIDTSKAFGSAGAYTLKITYKNYLPQVINLDVGEYVYLTGVTASMSTTTFAADARLSDNLSNNLTAGKQFNYTKYNENNIAYASFATKHLEVKLFNPSDVEASITTAFTTPGSWKVRVRSTDDNTKYADVAITVTPVKATGVTLSSSTLDLIEGATHTLTATVTPSTATDKTVTWSSNKESVATVNNGVVTAVSSGTATITATANDGSGAKGTCTVTVSEKPATETATITITSSKTNNQEWAMATSDFTCNGISITSVSSDKIFGTAEASARFASGSYGGSLTFSFAQKLIVGVKIYATKYSSDKPTITVTTSANTTGQSKGLDDNTSLVFDAFATDTLKSTSLTISSPKDHRFYLTKVELTIGSDTPIYPTSISLSGNATVGVGKTTNLTVNYTPATTNQKNVTWSSNNPSVATVNNGAVKGISTGNATITAKALKKDSTYATATFDITVVEEALDSYEKSLSLRKKVLGEEHPYTADSYNNIGTIYDDLGEHEKALEYYQKALDIRKIVLGEDHPYTADSYNNIGAIYNDIDENQKALEFHLKALSIRKQALGEDHPDIALSYNNLGNTYKNMGDYLTALKYYKKSLAISKKVIGDEHINLAPSYYNIGTIFKNQGEYNKALKYFQKAMTIREDFYGDEHPDTILSYNSIAMTYCFMGKYDEALTWAEKAFAAFPNVGLVIDTLATVYKGQGRYNEALELFEQCLKYQKEENKPAQKIHETEIKIEELKDLLNSQTVK